MYGTDINCVGIAKEAGLAGIWFRKLVELRLRRLLPHGSPDPDCEPPDPWPPEPEDGFDPCPDPPDCPVIWFMNDEKLE